MSVKIPSEQKLAQTIGLRLRSARKKRRTTLVHLAYQTGVDPATISRIETGRMLGTLESHLKLAQALRLTLSALYRGIEQL